ANLKAPSFIDSNGHTVPTIDITSASDGTAVATVLSSNLISRPKLTITDSTKNISTNVVCDFGSDVSFRNQGVIQFSQGYASDLGWDANSMPLTVNGDVSPVKVYLKFKKDTSGTDDKNYFKVNGVKKEMLPLTIPAGLSDGNGIITDNTYNSSTL